MPCPFFEPLKRVENAQHKGARLPLLDEYDGLCHAAGRAAVPEDKRFHCCNRGYSQGECLSFPDGGHPSCLRYIVHTETELQLRILCIEERDHTPVRWYEVDFDVKANTLADEQPAVLRAQVEAFSRSYLSRRARQ